MANTILTADVVLKEAKRDFVNQTPFISSMRRSYDGSYSAYGAKAGDAIRIKKNTKLTARTGKTMQAQNLVEESVSLARSNIYGVDLVFSEKELTMDLAEFSRDIIKPAISVLAAKVESAAMASLTKQVYNTITLPVTALDRADIIAADKMLNDFSAPGSDRFAVLSNQGYGDLLDANAALFNPNQKISRQYTEGFLGDMYNFSTARTSNIYSHTTGTYNGAHVVDGASQTGATLTVKTGTGAPTEGDTFTIAGVNSLNPVTLADTGELQVFTVGAGATASSWPISPSLSITGSSATVTALPADAATITEIGVASTSYKQNLFYHRDAFAFATADMMLPKGVDFAARNTEGNLSMSIIRDYDIVNSDILCRLDIVCGWVAVQPEFAVRAYQP